MIYKRIIVKGIVQGVGFRAFIYRNALKLPTLKGYVKNLPDGSVEIICRGEKKEVDELITAAKRGPWGSRVDSVEIAEIEIEKDIEGFSVAH